MTEITDILLNGYIQPVNTEFLVNLEETVQFLRVTRPSTGGVDTPAVLKVLAHKLKTYSTIAAGYQNSLAHLRRPRAALFSILLIDETDFRRQRILSSGIALGNIPESPVVL
jgi:hypothetical protein